MQSLKAEQLKLRKDDKTMTIRDQLKLAYTARLKLAIETTKRISHQLETILANEQKIRNMATVRKLLGTLSQAVHEASAYHNASIASEKGDS